MIRTEEERVAWEAEHRDDLKGVPCKYCWETAIVLELRQEFIAKPVGTFSLAGAQMKFSAIRCWWPWARCTACGHESKGKVEEP